MVERYRINPLLQTRRDFARLGRQRRALERRGQPVPDMLVKRQRQLDQHLAEKAPWWRPHFPTSQIETN